MASQDTGLDFEWLWDSPQFADFLLEVYVTNPQPEPHAHAAVPPSPVRPVCTPPLLGARGAAAVAAAAPPDAVLDRDDSRARGNGDQHQHQRQQDEASGSSEDERAADPRNASGNGSGSGSGSGPTLRAVGGATVRDRSLSQAGKSTSAPPLGGPATSSATATALHGGAARDGSGSGGGPSCETTASGPAVAQPESNTSSPRTDTHVARDQRGRASQQPSGSTAGTERATPPGRPASPPAGFFAGLLANALTPASRRPPAATSAAASGRADAAAAAAAAAAATAAPAVRRSRASEHGECGAAIAHSGSGAGGCSGVGAAGGDSSSSDNNYEDNDHYSHSHSHHHRRTARPARNRPQRQQLPVRVYNVHAPVLAATSEYFRALLRDWSGNILGEPRGSGSVVRRPFQGRGGYGNGGAGGAAAAAEPAGPDGSDGAAAGVRGVLKLHVAADEVDAADLMLRFMYTGRLPSGLQPRQLLRLLTLADQYRVTRLLSAANSLFAGLPLPGLSLEQLLALYELPEVLLEGGALSGALSKLVGKLVSELGDLELVMDCPDKRAQMVGLPFQALKLLLQSPDVRVWNENTAVAALVEWGGGPAGQAAPPAQRRQLVALLRLQHCTHSYLSHLLPQVPWLLESVDPHHLLLALSWARADATTRDIYSSEKLLDGLPLTAAGAGAAAVAPPGSHGGGGDGSSGDSGGAAAVPSSAASLALDAAGTSGPGAAAAAASTTAGQGSAASGPPAVFVSRPRLLSSRVTFDWSIDFATLQQLYADSKATRSLQVVTSEPAFFGGFHWWLRYDLDASQPAEYREHLGIACNVRLAGRKYSLPCVKVKATVCARQDVGSLGEGSFSLRKSFSYHVMHACPVGLWGFFGLTPDREEAAWRRFIFDGHVWLRCTIEECQ